MGKSDISGLKGDLLSFQTVPTSRLYRFNSSGGSRISQREEPTPRGCQPTIWPIFPKTAWRGGNFGPGRHVPCAPLDPPTSSLFEFRFWHQAKVEQNVTQWIFQVSNWHFILMMKFKNFCSIRQECVQFGHRFTNSNKFLQNRSFKPANCEISKYWQLEKI